MSNIEISKNEFITRLSELTPAEMLMIITQQSANYAEATNSKIATLENKHNATFDEIKEIKTSNQILNEKLNYMNDEQFKNLTNLGMDFNPQISDKSMSIILRWLGLTKYNNANINCKYPPVQNAIYNGYAREHQTKEINGKPRINHIWNSLKVQTLFVRKLKENNLLTDFENHISSHERNQWIRENLIK